MVDETADAQLAGTKLAWWRHEVAGLFAGNPQHPVTRALQPALAPYGITARRLNEIIDGMEMDLTQTRYLDFAGLERYCYHVAGVVGLLAAGIFGHTDPAPSIRENLARVPAHHHHPRLGRTSQDRIYMPIETCSNSASRPLTSQRCSTARRCRA